jgi:hypothetical protein
MVEVEVMSSVIKTVSALVDTAVGEGVGSMEVRSSVIKTVSALVDTAVGENVGSMEVGSSVIKTVSALVDAAVGEDVGSKEMRSSVIKTVSVLVGSSVGEVVGSLGGSVEVGSDRVGMMAEEGSGVGELVTATQLPPLMQQVLQHPVSQLTSSMQSALSCSKSQRSRGTVPVRSLNSARKIFISINWLNVVGIVPVN